MNDVGITINKPSIVSVFAIYFISRALHKYNDAFTVDASIFDVRFTSMFFITRNIVSKRVARNINII